MGRCVVDGPGATRARADGRAARAASLVPRAAPSQSWWLPARPFKFQVGGAAVL